MNSNELLRVIKKHQLWLESKAGGERADLRYADLSSANLRYADLSSANLRYADLSSADLRYADLRYADLSSANLRYADLSSADLSSADLSSADLNSADLRYADLRYADFSYANLQQANNLIWAECSFTGHGECGRRLIAVRIAGVDRYFCGCFSGAADELYRYIKNGDAELMPTRLAAFRFVWCQMAAHKNEVTK